jgi:hypothetical protein
MTGLVRKALTIAAGLVVFASVASAGVPSPANSVVDQVVVGNSGGSIIGTGFKVQVNDVNNAPLASRTVVLDFSATTMKVQQTQPAGTTVNCGAKTISRLTSGAGLATFNAAVGGFVNSNAVEVRAEGVVLANVKGRSTDCVNSGLTGDTGLPDFGYYAGISLASLTNQELDFDLVAGGAQLGDFAIFANQSLQAVQGAYCP